VFKSYSFHAGKPFARWVFDCTETITRKDLDIRAYQAELLRDEFYRQAGSMQWNLYCYFLCDEEAFNDLRSRGIVETVERDRAYARKFVRTPAMLKEDLSSLERIAAETTSDIPIDVGSLLQNTLAKQGLSAVFSELAYAEVVRLITAGQDAPDIGGEERKPGSDAVPRIEFIDALDLGGFRHRPRIPMFEFGCCNLIYGVNGSGKTSLLEGIELWMCGRHRRNPDASIEPGCVKLRIRGVSDWQPGPDSSIATYRERDHVWYGNYQARRNDLCFSFARFNFYDTDAAARLEISADDKEIESALPRLVLGETATRISERINRLLPTLKSEERECSTQVRNAEEAIRSARETIDSLEKPTESARQAYERMCAQLSLLGRRGAPPADSSDGCLGLLDFINEVATNIEAIASEITWIQTVSPAALEKDKQSLQTCCAALAEISGRVGTLDREKREVVATVENYEKQLKLLQRRLAFSEAGADALLGLEDRLREAQQRRASLVAASKEIEHIDLSRYSEISETVGQMAARLQSDAAQKEQLVAQAKATVASLEAVHGRIERLLSEVRATAQELFEVDTEARVCPVCGAQYRKGELFELVRHEISHVALPELHKAHTELARINEETERLNTTLRDLDVLQSVGHDVIGLASSDAQPVKDLVAALMSLERRIAQCNAELAQIRHDREQLHAKGFTEEELDFLNESLELEFADLPASTKTALEQKRTEIAQKRTFVEARLKACSEEIVTLKTREQALLAQHLGTEEAQPGDATKRFHQISLAVDRLHILLAVVDLNESRPLPEVLLHLNSLRKTVEGYARLRQQEEAVARVIRESEGKIRAAQETLEQKNPIRERLGKAIEVLDGIQTKHGAERYIKDFFDENLQQIGDLFRVIHAPQEFDKIVWVQEDAPGIRAMRKRDSALCRVSNLSSGQRNALSLAIFLTMNRKVRKGPSVIMLDDPVAHVDDLNIVSFFDCLREIHLGSGRQIFFTTASAKTANLFRKKFDYLGADRFREFELPL
jgi:DNA repair exonuclease SbcCD ATPase subunit